MGTLGQKLDYLTDTKSILKQKINNLGASLTDESTFRSYGNYLDELYNEMPKVTGEGTEITLTPTRKGRMQLGLKGNTSQDNTTGKNLIPTQISLWEQGTITYGSDTTSTTRIRTADYYPIENDKDYYISIQGNDYCFLNIWLYDTNKSVVGEYYNISSSINGATNQTINIPSSQISNVAYMRVVLCNKTSSATITPNELQAIKPQIEEGSTATAYEPYTGGQPSPNPDYPQDIHVVTGNNTIRIGSTDYPINLGSLELCKIGDYQDYLYKENGNWYKYKAITKIILDGTEKWKKSITYNGSYFIDRGGSSKFYIIIASSPLMCSHFIRANINSATQMFNYKQGSCFVESADGIFNVWYDDGTSTLEDFKSWLTANNLVVYCVLKTPSITQITDETLVSQLDAIENAMSTTETTTITQTNSDLPFIISASALKPFTTETLTASLTDGE